MCLVVPGDWDGIVGGRPFSIHHSKDTDGDRSVELNATRIGSLKPI